MTVKNSNNRKPSKTAENTPQRRSAQILFAIFAVILILSMVLSAATSF